MKKIISVLLAASLLAFTITGCTVPAKETEKAAPSAETSANKAEDAGTAAQPSTDEKMVLKVGTTAPPTTLVAQSAIMWRKIEGTVRWSHGYRSGVSGGFGNDTAALFADAAGRFGYFCDGV